MNGEELFEKIGDIDAELIEAAAKKRRPRVGKATVLLVAAGVLLMLVNFKVAHWVMHVVNKRCG